MFLAAHNVPAPPVGATGDDNGDDGEYNGSTRGVLGSTSFMGGVVGKGVLLLTRTCTHEP